MNTLERRFPVDLLAFAKEKRMAIPSSQFLVLPVVVLALRLALRLA